MKPDFWNGKRVFITGHTGFKGSWLSLWLHRLGAELAGYALSPPTQPSLFELARLGQIMHSDNGDVRDVDALSRAMKRHRPDIVIHMAAQPLVRKSYADPVETYSTNVMGTVHLFEAVRQSPSVRAVVNVTTDKCYENKEWVWPYRENEPMGGHDPYSSSKGCSELVTAAYRRSFFNPEQYKEHGVAIATARAGNVIGGGDWATDRLIPDVLNAFTLRQPVLIRNPHAIRPWQHVLEPLRGYLTLAQHLHEQGPSFSEPFNFGPGQEDAKPVQWIVEQMTQLWGSQASWQLDAGPHVHEAHHLKLDISKAGQRLDWYPRLQLKQALDLTVQWHRRMHQGEDPRQICLDQLQTYMASPHPCSN